MHGFVSQGAIKSTGNDYLVDSTRGSFQYSEAGINFTSQLTDRLRVGFQLFAYSLGTLGNYRVSGDWYYLDYRLRDWFGLRAGRLKIPLGFYSDIADVDAARVPVLLPASIYPATNRDYFLAQSGAEIYGYIGRGRAGGLEYRAYGGSIAIDLPNQAGSTAVASAIGVPFVGGGRLVWETPFDGLRFAASGVALRLEVTYVVPTLAPIAVRSDIYGGVGSVEYAARDLLLQAEYAQTRNVNSSTNPALVPAATIVSEGMYALGAYRVKRWLQPGAYYSLFFPDRSNRDAGRASVQHDLAATLRFDINDHWLVKLEGHYLHGTALVSGTAAERATAAEDWMLFLLKTTAWF